MSRSSARAERADVYNRITTEIIAAIEAGARNWRMPWHHDGAAVTRPENFSSHKRYRGVNVLALWAAAQASGYASGLWAPIGNGWPLIDRKSTRLNSSHLKLSRMPSSA